MGVFDWFFSNKCQALVDADGRMLTGDALKAAMNDPHARHCGNRIPLRAQYCNKCGSPAPNALVRCGVCRKWIAVTSKVCPGCGHRVDHSSMNFWDNGFWRKDNDIFAQRFEINNLAAQFRHGLSVEEGQCAILLENGMFVDIRCPGNMPSSDLGNLDEWVACGQNKSVVMVDASLVDYPLLFTQLRSKDDLELNLGCSVHLRFDQANSFLANIMSKRDFLCDDYDIPTIRYGAIVENLLFKETELAAQETCNAHSREELLKSPELRNELEGKLKEHLDNLLMTTGLSFELLSKVDFHLKEDENQAQPIAELHEASQPIAESHDVPQHIEKFTLLIDDFAVYVTSKQENVTFGRHPALNDFAIMDWKNNRMPDESPTINVSREQLRISNCGDNVLLYTAKQSTKLDEQALGNRGKKGVPIESDCDLAMGPMHFGLHIQYCKKRAKSGICADCMDSKVRSLSLSRKDGLPEGFALVWKSCDLKYIDASLEGFRLHRRNGGFLLETPSGNTLDIVCGKDCKDCGTRISVLPFRQRLIGEIPF